MLHQSSRFKNSDTYIIFFVVLEQGACDFPHGHLLENAREKQNVHIDGSKGHESAWSAQKIKVHDSWA